MFFIYTVAEATSPIHTSTGSSMDMLCERGKLQFLILRVKSEKQIQLNRKKSRRWGSSMAVKLLDTQSGSFGNVRSVEIRDLFPCKIK